MSIYCNYFKDPTWVSGFDLMEFPKLNAWFRSTKNAKSRYHAIGQMVNNQFNGGAKGFGHCFILETQRKIKKF